MAGPCRAYIGSACKRGHFGGFKRRLTSFRVAGVALCEIQTWFITWQKDWNGVFCVASTILLRRVQKLRWICRGRCSTLETSILISRGRRSTFEVSCGSFFVNHIVRAAGSGDKVQIPWQVWHFVDFAWFCCKLTEASYEISILR